MNSFSRVLKRWLALLGSFVIVLAAARGADDRIDLSHVIDKAAAESAIGEPVKAPAPRNLDGEDGYYSKCNYYSATSSKALILRLYQAGGTFDASKEMDAVKASIGTPKAVSGLGDKAQIYSGPESGLPPNVVMLYVVKGNSLVTVGLSGLDEESALDKTKRLAQKIVAQIH
jgi:hypothetical protein